MVAYIITSLVLTVTTTFNTCEWLLLTMLLRHCCSCVLPTTLNNGHTKQLHSYVLTLMASAPSMLQLLHTA